MPDSPFKDVEIDVPCPQCGEKTKRRLSEIRAETSYDCAGCGAVIKPDAADFDQQFRSVEQAYQRVLDAFKTKRKG